ncbi:MAG: hypothetical protein U5K30_03205 [Acidimicrobiales bacterium]|nr:hypothetical protein [Acidimicrobiales bacterium]
MRIEGHGIAVELPSGWEGEINRRSDPGPGDDTVSAAGNGTEARGADAASADEHPVTHLANFSLPGGRGDFGSAAVERMQADDVLVCLVEYGPAEADTPLFATQGVPTVTPAQFSPSQMQRTIAGMSGTQAFFTAGGRAFCLYAVVGSHARRRGLVPQVNELLQTLSIQPA